MVYLRCGHVHGQHDWTGRCSGSGSGSGSEKERECPLCRKCGPYVQLLVGLEPAFYTDSNVRISSGDCSATTTTTTTMTTAAKSTSPQLFKPFAFRPCGHMCSESTCAYWSRVFSVPQGTQQGLVAICPFCAVPLCKEQPFVKLIFQEAH